MNNNVPVYNLPRMELISVMQLIPISWYFSLNHKYTEWVILEMHIIHFIEVSHVTCEKNSGILSVTWATRRNKSPATSLFVQISNKRRIGGCDYLLCKGNPSVSEGVTHKGLVIRTCIHTLRSSWSIRKCYTVHLVPKRCLISLNTINTTSGRSIHSLGRVTHTCVGTFTMIRSDKLLVISIQWNFNINVYIFTFY